MRFATVETLRPTVESAARRWSLATGCAVVIGEPGDGGVPIELSPLILRPDGSEAYGATTIARDRVRISAKAHGDKLDRAVLHEMGHALGGDHVVTEGVLSGSKDYQAVIDAPSLESVCARLPCPGFSPE